MELQPRTGIRPLLYSVSAILATAVVLSGSSAAAKLAASEQAEIKFVATQEEVPVEGKFTQFSADVDFDLAKPALGKVNVVIDVASVDTGSSDADGLLKSSGFLDAAHFPRATFTSTSIKATDAGKFLASGQFTLKGRSLALVIPFVARPDGAGTWFEGDVPLSRLAYKVGEGEWADTGTLADKVLIRFKLYVPR